jgi:glutathione peroxidase-family protein
MPCLALTNVFCIIHITYITQQNMVSRAAGQDVSFERFRNKVVLITNVACACGYTRNNYKVCQASSCIVHHQLVCSHHLHGRLQELVELHDKYNALGLEVVAFPCNQFGGQEPGSPEEIRQFVSDRQVNFTMMVRSTCQPAPERSHSSFACALTRVSCAGQDRRQRPQHPSSVRVPEGGVRRLRRAHPVEFRGQVHH